MNEQTQQEPCCMNYVAGTTCFNDPRIDCPHLSLAELKPCRSPYCECVQGECTHPGFYDARHMTQIMAGAEIHSGDDGVGYSIGTQEKYEEFVKMRNEN